MYRVLIVDDELTILNGLSCIINWADYGLEIAGQASNGIEAMEIMVNLRINILITDIKMPKLGGLELIRFIKDKGLNIKCIILSGYDDFEFVKEAAILGIENYLLKPVNVDELTSTLINTVFKIESEVNKQIAVKEGLNVLRDNILYRWVSGNIEEDELLERSSLLNINLDSTEFLVAVIKSFHNTDESDLSKIHGKGLSRFAVNNICAEIICQDNYGVSFCDFDGDEIIVFSSHNAGCHIKDLEKILKKCIESVNLFLHLDVFITVGSYVNKYQDVYQSYSYAKKLQEYCLITPLNTIVYYDELTNPRLKKQEELVIDFQTLNKFITKKDTVSAVKFIDDIYNRLHEIDGLTPLFVQNLTTELLFYIVEAIRALYSNPDIIFENSRDMFSSIFKINTIDVLKERLKGMVAWCIDFLASEDEKASPMVKKALDYIRKNYSKDINLKTISANFNLSAAYLGYLFRKETGDSFTNYLNKIRVEKAKELLLNTNMRVIEVSEKVGYVNTNYFFIIFKKMTGMSPSEFKG